MKFDIRKFDKYRENNRLEVKRATGTLLIMQTMSGIILQMNTILKELELPSDPNLIKNYIPQQPGS